MALTERQQFRAEYILTALDNGIQPYFILALVKEAEKYVFGDEEQQPVSKDKH